MGLSSINPEFPCGFLESTFELPWDHGKKQLRTASAIVWIPIQRGKNILPASTAKNHWERLSSVEKANQSAIPGVIWVWKSDERE